MTILVTGGAGFIGANFARKWLEKNVEPVVNLDLLAYAGNLENLAGFKDDNRHTFVQGNISDQTLVQQLLAKHRPRAVLNFAAESHVDRSINNPDIFIRTNVVGTFNLLESVRAYWSTLDNEEKAEFRFLHVSTDEVYGSLCATDSPSTENALYAPNSPYSASKAASDHLVRAYHHTYGLPTLTTNCSNNYGPYQFPEKLIPLIIYKALMKEPLPIYGDGSNIRDWLFVEDHCSALCCVLEAGRSGEVYNIGGSSEKTNLQVVHAICDLLDEMKPDPEGSYKRLITYVQDRPGHDWRYALDASKIHNDLGWVPAESFESGILKTVRWYLDNFDWTERVVSKEDQEYLTQSYEA